MDFSHLLTFIAGVVVTLIVLAVFGTCRERMRDRYYEPDIHDL